MAITLNGTTGITNDGGYTGDGVSFADNTPANTLVTDTSGNVGIGGLPVANNQLTLYRSTFSQFRMQNATTGTGTSDGFRAVMDGVNTTITNHEAGYMAFETSDVERMRIDSSGNLLVGTTSGTNYTRMNLSTDSGTNKWDVGPRLTLATNFYILQNTTNGVYIASGANSWTAFSDERIKTDLKPIENAVEKVKQLRSVTGRFVNDEENKSRAFLIAQDVDKVLPEAVDKSDTEKWGVAYTDTIPLLVAAIKELKTELDSVKAELATLKGAA